MKMIFSSNHRDIASHIREELKLEFEYQNTFSQTSFLGKKDFVELIQKEKIRNQVRQLRLKNRGEVIQKLINKFFTITV